MSFDMRLFQKRGWYHAEISRNKSRALNTKDEQKAKAIFKAMERAQLKGKLFDLEKVSRVTLSDFRRDAEEIEELKEKGEYCNKELSFIAYREGLNDLSMETIKKDKLSLKLLSEANGGSTLLVSVDIEKFKSNRLTNGAKKITINGYLRHLKTAFKWAVEKGYLKKVPKIVMYKRLRKPEAALLEHILEPEEIKAFLRKAYKRGRDWGDYCLITLYTGGRRLESLDIEYQKSDFRNDKITLGETGKTGARTIPILRPVKVVLQRDKKDIGRKFPNWHPDTVSHWAQETFKDAGVIGHKLHDLRHTCATYLLKNKVPLEVVQRIMGHANISTTQIYAKVLDGILQTEMKKLRFK